MSRQIIFLPFAAVLALTAVFAACGDDDDNATNTPAATTAAASATAAPSAAAAPTEAEGKAFIQELIGNYNAGDLDAFLAMFSDEGLIAFVGDDSGTSRAKAEQDAKDNLNAGTITSHEVTKKSATAADITMNVVSDNGQTVEDEDFTIAQGDTDLVVTAYQRNEPTVPSDSTKVLVEGTEYQYITDTSAITSGKVAFEFSNIGSQFHEMYLLKIDDTTPVQQVVDDGLAATDPSQLPASILKDLGPVVAVPGSQSNYVPAQPLDAGRYLMICFIPDEADQAPHASKGMFKDFTIP